VTEPAAKGAMTLMEFRALFDEVSNWGRWGADDELGALNLITAEHRIRAASLVTEGKTIGFSTSVVTTGPTTDGFPPARHHMIQTYDLSDPNDPQGYVMDYVGIAAHGHMFTHLDTLCHMSFDGRIYNGAKASDAVKSRGALSHGMDAVKDGIVSRGVLFDIPAVREVNWLDPGDSVYPSDLDAAEEAGGVSCGPGDILLVRTGKHRREKELGSWSTLDAMPGLHPSTLPWIRERDIAVFGSDTSSDTYPSPIGGLRSPIHMGLLVSMGVHMIDNCMLEELTESCRKLGRWEFMTVIGAIRLAAATGMVINPIAVL